MKTKQEYLDTFERSYFVKSYTKLKKQGIYEQRVMDKELSVKKAKMKKGYYKKLYQLCRSLWALIIQQRAKFKCQICGQDATDSHHIVPVGQCKFMELDLENGLAVCKRCHGVAMGQTGFHGNDGKVWKILFEKYPGLYEKLLKKKKESNYKRTVGDLEIIKKKLLGIVQ